MKDEGRRYKRLGASWIVKIRSRKATESSVIRMTERIKNISLGGVFIETSHPFAKGSVVEFDFTLPGQQQLVHAKGIVKWANDGRYHDQPRGMGVEFVEVTTAAQGAITGYVENVQGSDPMAGLLTSPDHAALLKFYRGKVGETFQMDALAKASGVPVDRLITVLSDFAIYDLVGMSGSEIRLKACGDAGLKAAIDAWTPNA